MTGRTCSIEILLLNGASQVKLNSNSAADLIIFEPTTLLLSTSVVSLTFTAGILLGIQEKFLYEGKVLYATNQVRDLEPNLGRTFGSFPLLFGTGSSSG